MKGIFLSCALMAFASTTVAEELVSADTISGSENAVITDSGRYFVAAEQGVFEVSRAPGAGCDQESSGLHVCKVLSPKIQGQPCFMTGMTTNGTDLYGACTLGNPQDPVASAFFLMKPGVDVGQLSMVESKNFTSPVWYNGMAVHSSGDIYMTASAHMFPKAAIVKLQLDSSSDLSFTLSDWKINTNEFMPNGIRIDGDTMYYVGGQQVYKIAINGDGSAGFPRQIYFAGLDRLMDDLAVVNGKVVVSEFPLLGALLGIDGLGDSQLTLIDPNGGWWSRPSTINTGSVIVSSLVGDPNGVVGDPGSIVATSYFDSGIHQF